MSIKVIKYLKWLKKTNTSYDFNLSNLQPFVFSKSLGKENNLLHYQSSTECILACPFPVFSIEIEEENFLIDDEQARVDCILCRVVTVGLYDFLLLGKSQNSAEKLWLRIDPSHDNNNRICQLVNAAITRIHVKVIGEKSNLDKVKYKNTLGKKQIFQPRKYVYVSSQNKTDVRPSLSTDTNIKWLNRWTVMAHWRKLANPNSFGINRSGIRNVLGYTFIKNHEKGDGELIIKTRKVS